MQDKIEHRIGISAPPAVVWEVLSDLDAWPEWTGLYSKVVGKIGFGEPLVLTVTLGDRPVREINAVVFDWTPEEAIHWRTRIFAGLAWSVRFLEIEAMTDTACFFNNGEIFGGMLAPEAVRPVRKPLKSAFAAMGEALKVRAEALWQERSSGAT